MSRIAYLAAAIAAITGVGLGSPALATAGTPARAVAALTGSPAHARTGPRPAEPAASQTTQPAAASRSASRQVTLVTGDVVTVRTDASGHQHVSVARGQHHGVGRAFQTFSMGSDVYVVPQSAVPFLHSVLDPRLFDVTALAKQAAVTSTTVGITYRAGAAHRPIPGVRITKHAGNTATGVVTRATGRAFGTALAAQWQRDHASPTHTTGLFADVSSLHPATAPAPAARPDYPMHTLTLKGINASGGKDTGDSVAIFNVDDLRRYAGFPFFVNGIAKISVPVGHYSAVALFFDPSGAARFVTIPQFTISGAGSVTVDARAASRQVSIATPRPATIQSLVATVGRTDARGATGSTALLGDATTRIYVNPTSRPPSIGQLHFYVYAHEASAPRVLAAYTYDVEFPSDGVIPATERYVVTPASLATTVARYDSDTPNRPGLETEFSALPWEFFLFRSDFNVTTPLTRTEYYSANPQISWQHTLFPYFDPKNFYLEGEYDSAYQTYRRGTTTRMTWLRQPLHQRLLEGNVFPGQTVCPACVSGRTVDVLAFPFGDNDPDHYGYPTGSVPGYTENIHYGLYADDVPLKTGTDFLDAQVKVPAAARTLRIDYDTHRFGKEFTLSTDVVTRWTVPVAGHGVPLPSGWTCSDRGASRNCAVLPLLTNSYQLPTDSLGRLKPGHVTGTLTVSHLTGNPQLPLSKLAAELSFDGAHWSPIRVTALGNATYRLGFGVPPASATHRFGSLRITAADPAGSTLSQTISHAFAVAGA